MLCVSLLTISVFVLPHLPTLPVKFLPLFPVTDFFLHDRAERREEIRQLKRELSGRDKKTKKQDKPEEKVSEEQLEDTKDTTKVSAVKEYWIEKQKSVLGYYINVNSNNSKQ